MRWPVYGNVLEMLDEGRLELGENVLLEPGVWLTAPAPARFGAFSRVIYRVDIGSTNDVALEMATGGEPEVQIDFTAKSWAYDISNRQIETGKPVRFSGRASDTQHGFAVYHPDGRVLFTMLMMPGTTKPTSVVYTFKEPGKYKVRCLEYCGIAHHAMQDELTVVKSN